MRYTGQCDLLNRDEYKRERSTVKGAIGAVRYELLKNQFMLENQGLIARTIVDDQLDRADVTRILTKAASMMHYRFSTSWLVFTEVMVYGGRRADVLAIDYHGEVRILEVKSCREDFTSDKKWESYLKSCHRLSFVTPPGIIDLSELPPEVGLYELNTEWPAKGDHPLIARRHAKKRKIESLAGLYLHLLWRSLVTYHKGEETLAADILEFNMRGAR